MTDALLSDLITSVDLLRDCVVYGVNFLGGLCMAVIFAACWKG